jgi:hypothetical protein
VFLVNIPFLLIVWVYRFRDLIAISNYNFVNNESQADFLGIRKKLLVVTDFGRAYHNSIFNIITAFLGMNVDYWFFLLQMFINFFLFRSIRYLTAAFWVNGFKFLALMLFIVFTMIPISYIIKENLSKEFIINEGSI